MSIPLRDRPRAPFADALLPWLAAGALAGLGFGVILARRNQGSGLGFTGVAGLVGLSSLLFMGLASLTGCLLRTAGAGIPSLRDPAIHGTLAFPALAGFAAYSAAREFEYPVASGAALTLAISVLTSAASREWIRKPLARPVMAVLTLVGAASVAWLVLLTWLVSRPSAPDAAGDDYEVVYEPLTPVPARASGAGRVVWLAFDDIWELTDPRVDTALNFPNLRRLTSEGTGGYFDCQGLTGDAAWTTAATGRPPKEHGIGGQAFPYAAFLPRSPLVIRSTLATGFLESLKLLRTGAYTSNQRRTKALWNMATDAGLTSRVVGFPVTFPAESVRGEVLTPAALELEEGSDWGAKSPGLDRLAFPAAMLGVVVDEAARGGRELRETVPQPWWQRNRLARRMALRDDPAGYPHLTICHLQFKARGISDPEGPLTELDRFVGDILHSLGPLDTLLLVGIRRVNEYEPSVVGRYWLHGPGVAPTAKSSPVTSLTDITPCILRRLGLPLSRDLTHHAPFAPNADSLAPAMIPTWETSRTGRLDAYPPPRAR